MTGLSDTMRGPGIVRTPVQRFHHGQTARQSTSIESVTWDRNSDPAGQTSPLIVAGRVNIGRSGLRDMAAEQGNRPVPEKSLHELCHPRGIRRSVSNGLMRLSRWDAQKAFPNRGAVLPVGVWDVHYSGSGHRHSRTVMGHTGCSSHNSPWISGSPLEDLGRLPRSRWNRLVTYIPVKWSHLRNSYSPTGDQAL